MPNTCGCGAVIDDEESVCNDCWLEHSAQCVVCDTTFYAPRGEKVCDDCPVPPCRVCGTYVDNRDAGLCDRCWRDLLTMCEQCSAEFDSDQTDGICPSCHYSNGLQAFVCIVCSEELEVHYTDTICTACKKKLSKEELKKARLDASSVEQGDAVQSCSDIHFWIVDERTGEAVAQKATWIVGQRVSLSLFNSAGAKMENVRWGIDGECIAAYTCQEGVVGSRSRKAEPSFGRVMDLTAWHLSGELVEFYWIKRGRPVVRVEADINGHRHKASARVTVVGPTGVVMTSQTDRMHVGQVYRDDVARYLTFGGIADSNKPGIRWTCTATAPEDGDGQLACTQLIRINRNRVTTDDQNHPQTSDGNYVLDEVLHYNIDVGEDDDEGSDDEDSGEDTFEMGIEAEATVTIACDDSPASPVSRRIHREDNLFNRRYTIDDAFVVYFLYKPFGDDSIFVTLAKLEWHCSAVAVWNTDKFEIESSDSSVNPSGSLSFELPQWEGNRNEIMKE